MNLYGIYDVKAGYFLPALEASTDEHAERIVADAIQAGNQMLAQHRNDFMLYCLAQYDNKTGMITQDSKPDMICTLADLVSRYFPNVPKTTNGAAPEYPDQTTTEILEENSSVYDDPPVSDDS